MARRPIEIALPARQNGLNAEALARTSLKAGDDFARERMTAMPVQQDDAPGAEASGPRRRGGSVHEDPARGPARAGARSGQFLAQPSRFDSSDFQATASLGVRPVQEPARIRVDAPAHFLLRIYVRRLLPGLLYGIAAIRRWGAENWGLPGRVFHGGTIR